MEPVTGRETGTERDRLQHRALRREPPARPPGAARGRHPLDADEVGGARGCTCDRLLALAVLERAGSSSALPPAATRPADRGSCTDPPGAGPGHQIPSKILPTGSRGRAVRSRMGWSKAGRAWGRAAIDEAAGPSEDLVEDVVELLDEVGFEPEPAPGGREERRTSCYTRAFRAVAPGASRDRVLGPPRLIRGALERLGAEVQASGLRAVRPARPLHRAPVPVGGRLVAQRAPRGPGGWRWSGCDFCGCPRSTPSRSDRRPPDALAMAEACETSGDLATSTRSA
jgi:hypothetical protein